MRRRALPTIASTALCLALLPAPAPSPSRTVAAADPVLPAGAVVDEFDADALGPEWDVLNPDPTRWSLTENPGHLRLRSLTGDTYQELNSAKNMILRDIPRGDFEVIAKFDVVVTLDFQNAGLLLWQDMDNHMRIGLANLSFFGGPSIENALEVNGAFSSQLTAQPGATGEILRVVRTGNVFTTSYWTDAGWAPAGQVTADIDVTQVGLFALSAQNGTPITADFDYFAVTQASPRTVTPAGPFALEGVDGPYLSKGNDGLIAVSPRRSATQLRLRAGDAGGGNVTLTADGGERVYVRPDRRLGLARDPRPGSDVFGFVDAGGGKVRMSAGTAGHVTVAGGGLRTTTDATRATKLLVRPYSPDGTLNVDGAGGATLISDRLFGVFYEDINHAADGGLYAELVQNRSFEFEPVDNRSYHGMTAWEQVGTGGTVAVTTDAPLNANNLHQLTITSDAGGVGVRNAGFNTGVVVKRGQAYDFSVWARATQPATLAVTVTAGASVLGRATIEVADDTWRKYAARITATGSTSAGRLAVVAGGAGTLKLDMVSLFPSDTYKGHGMREDLARMVAALKPSFLRFPGGCVTNVGNYAPFPDRRRIYRWKETIGPVEQRPTNFNFWGYNQSYGIGYFEYFQFAEDIGAEALPVVSVGVNGCGENRPLAEDQLGPWVQDTLDLIEFANGPVTSTWGAVRAAMGHPKPFGLEYIGLGNEEIFPEFYRNYPHFSAAIRAAYPNIKVVTNSGQTSSGQIFDRGWAFAREQGADLVDEHYYNTPAWFLANNHRYDEYDRTGPHVFVGEYASRSNTFASALAEASYMTGIERNGDVIDLASYAPLLSNVDYVNWTPDLIWFDNDEAFESSSSHVQKLFSVNRGDRVLPSAFAGGEPSALPEISGQVGLATWNTQAVYDDVKVTAADGTVLLTDDFSAGAGAWNPMSGSWSVVDGAFAQSSGATPAQARAGSLDWSNYTMEVTARKTGGAEGFLIMFGASAPGQYYWWNLGGFGNAFSAIERVGGGSTSIATSPHIIETGRTYHIKITVFGRTITTFLDGVQVNRVTDTLGLVEPLYQVVTRDDRTGDIVVKVVNARAGTVRTTIALDGVRVGGSATVTSLTSRTLHDINLIAQPNRTAPVITEVSGLGRNFVYDFPAHSVTFIRLPGR